MQRALRLVVRAVLVIAVAVVGACAHAPPPCGAGFAPLSSTEIARPVPSPTIERRPFAWVTAVRIAGVGDDLARLLGRSIATRPGMQVDEAPLQDDLRTLWRSGVIRDVHVEVEHGDEIVFVVTPRRLVERVAVRGIDGKTARRFHLLAGALYEPARIQRMVDEAQLSYVREGRVDATVEARRAAAGDRVAVCVVARRGPKVTIDALAFPGRTGVPAATLIAALHGKEAKVNRVGGTFDRDALIADTVFLEAEYWNRGYIDVHVSEPSARRTRKGLVVEVPIREGPRYRLRRIATRYPVGTPLRLRPGEVFDRSRIAAEIERLRTRTGALDVRPTLNTDPAHRTVDITFELEWKWPWDAFRTWR